MLKMWMHPHFQTENVENVDASAFSKQHPHFQTENVDKGYILNRYVISKCGRQHFRFENVDAILKKLMHPHFHFEKVGASTFSGGPAQQPLVIFVLKPGVLKKLASVGSY